jgi:TonB family protein
MRAIENSQRLGEVPFGLLPQHAHRTRSFGASLLINATLGAVVIVLSILRVPVLQVHTYQSTPLLFPTQQLKPRIPPALKINEMAPVRLANPKVELSKPKPVLEPPKVVEVRLAVSPPRFETAPPRRVQLSPDPKPSPQVRTGIFGDPEGVTPNPSAERQPTIAVQGVNFGSGLANGVSGGRNRGAIASAGFASGGVGGRGGAGSHGKVTQAGFGTTQYGAGAVPEWPLRQPETTPIVVLSKPLPSYTAEARQLKIEGDVTLQVCFTASGSIQVLRVISGLGHGLDEEAWIAAEHIRFRPATKDGRPVDEVSVIRVTFQLA